MDDNIFSVHSEISSGLKGKQISINLHFTWTKNQAVSETKHNSIFIPHPEGLLLFFLLNNWMWFAPSEKNTLQSAAGHCVCFRSSIASFLPLSSCAAPHHKGSDTSGHKNLFMKPRLLGLDSQSFIRQLTPRRSLQSSEVHNKILTTITASFSLFLSEDQQLTCLTERIWQMWFLLWQMATLSKLLHLRTPDNIPGKWRWPLDRKNKSPQSLNYLTKPGHEWI